MTPLIPQAELLNEIFPAPFVGNAVEVGANDGIFLSNTKHLEESGWRVLCIEPNTYYEEELRRNRKECLMVACGAPDQVGEGTLYRFESSQNRYAARTSLIAAGDCSDTIKVPVLTLDTCLDQAGFTSLDLASIDVENTEEAVMRGFSLERWMPKCLIIENWGGDKEYHPRLAAAGYVLRAQIDMDYIWVRP